MIVLGCLPPPLESNFVVDRGGDGQRRPSKPGGSERWSSGGKAGEARYFERRNDRIARQRAKKAERMERETLKMVARHRRYVLC